MITSRDTKVLNFLSEFKVAKTSTLEELFYPSYRIAARRLTDLANIGAVNREKNGFSAEYIYYINKPKQLRHALVLTDFYRELHKIAEIAKFIPEPTLGNMRPDALVGFNLNKTNRLAMVEVELSHKGFNSAKYDNFDWKEHLGYEPELIVISDFRCECNKFKICKINTELDLTPLIDG